MCVLHTNVILTLKGMLDQKFERAFLLNNYWLLPKHSRTLERGREQQVRFFRVSFEFQFYFFYLITPPGLAPMLTFCTPSPPPCMELREKVEE